MASPTTVAHNWTTAPAAHRPLPRPAAGPRVQVIARFAFWTLFLLTLFNVAAMFITYQRSIYGSQYMLGIYPVVFAIAATFVFAFSRGRYRSVILLVGWGYWLVYFLGGFLGPNQITTTYFRATLEITIKPWMTLVGLPWLALRAISEDKAPRLMRATVVVTSIGAVLAIVQMFDPNFMGAVTLGGGRGSGFWGNPNTGGVMCSLALFLSFIYPFERRPLNWTARLLLIAGIAASLSRIAILATMVGWAVYGLTARRFGSLLASALALLIFVAGMFLLLDIVEAVSPIQAKRMGTVAAFLKGDWSSEEDDNRTEIWRTTFETIELKGGFIFGLGHGSMARVADGLVPHNYYLAVLGNSGVFALLALLIWHFSLFQQAWTCQRRETRAALFAIATILMAVHMTDSSFIDHPSTGAMVACITIATCYGALRRNVPPDRVPPGQIAVNQRMGRRAAPAVNLGFQRGNV